MKRRHVKTFSGKRAEMVLSYGELKYLLFCKKLCPQCGEKMKRTVKNEFFRIDDGTTGAPMELYEYRIFYRCDRCGRDYPLAELAERRKQDKALP